MKEDIDFACDALFGAVLGALVLALASCASTSPTTGGAPETRATCGDVCDRYRALGCVAGEPTLKGVPCEDVCANIVLEDVQPLDLQCRAHAETCAAADRCEDLQ